MTTTRTIEELALRWMEARDRSDRLRLERNAIDCVHEEITQYPSMVCFKWYAEEDGLWTPNRERADWCAACLRRQEIHEQYVRARNTTSSRMAALHRTCRAKLERDGVLQKRPKRVPVTMTFSRGSTL